MTIGQLSFYDQIKLIMLTNFSEYFEDNIKTHLVASTVAGGVATTLCQVHLISKKLNNRLTGKIQILF